jgi:hypothetical protein
MKHFIFLLLTVVLAVPAVAQPHRDRWRTSSGFEHRRERAVNNYSGGDSSKGLAIAVAASLILRFLTRKKKHPKNETLSRGVAVPAREARNPVESPNIPETALKPGQRQQSIPASSVLIRTSYSGNPNMRSANKLFGR